MYFLRSKDGVVRRRLGGRRALRCADKNEMRNNGELIVNGDSR